MSGQELKTGFAQFDRLAAGGFKRGELCIFAGRLPTALLSSSQSTHRNNERKQQMPRKTKTPAKLIELIRRQQGACAHTTEALQVKKAVPFENQNAYIRTLSEDRIVGQMEGMNSMLETTLMEFNCYAGFYYQSPGGDRLGHIDTPDFAEWRRNYIVRM